MVDLVRHASWGPARIFGLDHKGALAPGFDADIVVFDPEVKHTISAETHVMNVDYDPFEGWEVTGKPRFVLSRGETVYADGKVVSQPGHGRFVKRSLFEPVWRADAEFGVTVLPDPPYQRLVELIVKAEQLGFDSGWTYDSPILWQEPYPLITLLAAQTERMRIGMCVTNPVTREPAVTASAHATLQDISGGRMVMGIGRGDSRGARDGPQADEDRRVRAAADDDQGVHERAPGGVGGHGDPAQVGAGQAGDPALRRRLRAARAGRGGARRRRRDHPARRPGDHRVDDGHGAARRPRRRGATRRR